MTDSGQQLPNNPPAELSTETPAPASPIHLLGTTLEGGGQLVRLSLSLSSLTRLPLHITSIRGNRGPKSQPGKDGGIKPVHFAGATFLEKATNAVTEGLEIRSSELLFKPSVGAEPDRRHAGSAPEGEEEDGVWKDVKVDGQIVRREAQIWLNTPGSVLLVLQAILPFLLFSSQPHRDSLEGFRETPVPLRIKIYGGTNVWHSLSIEYAQQVLFPMLHKFAGVGPITAKLEHRGWTQGKATIGSVTFDITPLPHGSFIPAFEYTSRGPLKAIYASILAPSGQMVELIRERVVNTVEQSWGTEEVDIYFPVEENSGHRARLYLLLVAEFESGMRIGRDWIYDRKFNHDQPEKTVKALVGQVFADLKMELAQNNGESCVDEYLQDQLVVFQSLAKGRATIQGREPSMHTKTARWVAGEMLGVEWGADGNCDGIGFAAGQDRWEKK